MSNRAAKETPKKRAPRAPQLLGQPGDMILPISWANLENAARPSATLRRKWAEAGYNGKCPPEGIHASVWNEVVDLVRLEMFPELPEEEGFRALGRRLFLVWPRLEVKIHTLTAAFGNLTGRAVCSFGTQKALEFWHWGCKYGRRDFRITWTPITSTSGKTTVQAVATPPGVLAGNLEALLLKAGARDVQVRIVNRGPDYVEFHSSWT